MNPPPTARPRPSLLPVAYGMGAAAVVAQTVLVRELMVSFYGTEPALAAAMCGWLLFVPAGALLGVGALRLAPGRERLLLWCALAGMALALPTQFLLARLVRPLLGAQTGEFLPASSIIAGALLASFPVALPVGIAFPAAARAQEQLATRPGAGIGGVYVAEAVGSGVAGALLSFALLGRTPAAALALGTAGGLLLLLAWWSWRERARSRAAAGLLLALAAAAVLFGWGPRIEAASARGRWRTFSRFDRVAGRETRYQHVELGRRAGEYVLVQDGQISAQFPDAPAAARQSALALTQHPRPECVLVIGGGLTGLCQQLLQAPVGRVDYAAPDPRLIRFVLDGLPAELRAGLDDPRFSAYACDGRRLVRRPAAAVPVATGARRAPAGAYDLIVVNVGDPTAASAARFFTVEFCGELAQALRPGGAVGFCGLTGSENYVRGGPALAYAACLYRTLREVFPHVVVSPGGELAFFAALQDGVVSSAPEVLSARFDAMGLTPELLKHAFELAEFPPERVAALRRLLGDAAPGAPLNADARPVLFTLFLELQAHYAARRGGGVRALESPGPGLWSRARAASAAWLALPAAVLLAVALTLRVGLGGRRSAPWACGLAVFTTGMFGLSAEMLIVYGYQVQFGYVYRDIAVIVGLFMLGLALGGWVWTRAAGARGRRPLLAAECAQALFVLALPAAASALVAPPFAFMLLSPAAGFLTGCEFPLAARVSLRLGAEAGLVAGAYDAADHLGALAGAALTGLLLVPAFGLAQTAAALALIKCASLAGLLLCSAPGVEAT